MHEGTWRTSFVFITDSLLPNRRVDYIGRRSDGRTVKIARFLHVNLTVLGTSQREWGKKWTPLEPATLSDVPDLIVSGV